MDNEPQNTPASSNHTIIAGVTFLKEHLVVFGILLASTIFAVGYAGYLYVENEDQNETIADLKGRLVSSNQNIESLRVENASLLELSELSSAEAELGYGLASYFVEKFDQLDEILLKTDTNSLEAIEWFTDNGLFTDSDIASYIYGSWLAVQNETDQEYKALKLDLEDLLEELNSVENNNNITS